MDPDQGDAWFMLTAFIWRRGRGAGGDVGRQNFGGGHAGMSPSKPRIRAVSADYMPALPWVPSGLSSIYLRIRSMVREVGPDSSRARPCDCLAFFSCLRDDTARASHGHNDGRQLPRYGGAGFAA